MEFTKKFLRAKSPLGVGAPGGLFCCIVPKPVLYWWRCPSPFWQQKGVDIMDTILTNFLVAVAAQVAAHFLCKWLDPDDEKGE